MTDYLIVLNQKIPDWFLKITYLGEAETANRLALNLDLVSWAFSGTILGWWFSL